MLFGAACLLWQPGQVLAGESDDDRSVQAVVTGGWGYLGRHLAQVLRERGVPVTVLDVKEPPPAQLSQDRGFHFIQTDITAPDAVAEAFRKLEGKAQRTLVFHAAGISSAGADPDDILETNVEGTKNIASALSELAKAGRKSNLLFVSSGAVYGKEARPGPSETDLLGSPATMYADSKQRAERFLLNNLHGVPWTVVRPAAVIGSRGGLGPLDEYGEIGRWVREILSGGRAGSAYPVPVVPGPGYWATDAEGNVIGEKQRGFVDVGYLAEAMVALALHGERVDGRPGVGIYNGADPAYQLFSASDWLAAAARVLGPFAVVGTPSGDVNASLLNGAKLGRFLNDLPEARPFAHPELEQSIRDTEAAHRRAGHVRPVAGQWQNVGGKFPGDGDTVKAWLAGQLKKQHGGCHARLYRADGSHVVVKGPRGLQRASGPLARHAHCAQ